MSAARGRVSHVLAADICLLVWCFSHLYLGLLPPDNSFSSGLLGADFLAVARTEQSKTSGPTALVKGMWGNVAAPAAEGTTAAESVSTPPDHDPLLEDPPEVLIVDNTGENPLEMIAPPPEENLTSAENQAFGPGTDTEIKPEGFVPEPLADTVSAEMISGEAGGGPSEMIAPPLPEQEQVATAVQQPDFGQKTDTEVAPEALIHEPLRDSPENVAGAFPAELIELTPPEQSQTAINSYPAPGGQSVADVAPGSLVHDLPEISPTGAGQIYSEDGRINPDVANSLDSELLRLLEWEQSLVR